MRYSIVNCVLKLKHIYFNSFSSETLLASPIRNVVLALVIIKKKKRIRSGIFLYRYGNVRYRTHSRQFSRGSIFWNKLVFSVICLFPRIFLRSNVEWYSYLSLVSSIFFLSYCLFCPIFFLHLLSTVVPTGYESNKRTV